MRTVITFLLGLAAGAWLIIGMLYWLGDDDDDPPTRARNAGGA